MKTSQKRKSFEDFQTWEESSGFLSFLSSVPGEVDIFNDRLGFGIEIVTSAPQEIDGDRDMPHRTGFVLERKNPLLPEFRYCLYSLLKERALYGYIGIFDDGTIRTVKKLQPIHDFKKGAAVLHGWLTQLVRASCEKIML